MKQDSAGLMSRFAETNACSPLAAASRFGLGRAIITPAFGLIIGSGAAAN
jgi:hypothetical protein